MIDTSVSYMVISERYGIGRSTAVDIMKSQKILECFSKKMVDLGMMEEITKIIEYIYGSGNRGKKPFL